MYLEIWLFIHSKSVAKDENDYASSINIASRKYPLLSDYLLL